MHTEQEKIGIDSISHAEGDIQSLSRTIPQDFSIESRKRKITRHSHVMKYDSFDSEDENTLTTPEIIESTNIDSK